MTRIRIDKLLANMGIGSRSEIKKIAKQGRIKLNGVIEKNTAVIVDSTNDQIVVDDKLIQYKEFIYLMMNKPQNVVSATDDNLHRTVIDLLPEEHKIYKPFPVGRLDKDTEGLLIITNDGQLAHQLVSPGRHVNKKYYVEVSGKITTEDIKRFEEGITLDDGYKTMPAELNLISYSDETNSSCCTVIIQEGKYHQIKRMFADVQKKVLFLKRIEIGTLVLDPTLSAGEYRELTQEELRYLRITQGESNEKKRNR